MSITHFAFKTPHSLIEADGIQNGRKSRKEAGLTQEEFALRSGLGLRFIHELERGKPTVRLDKVNQALAMFGMEAVPGRMERQTGEEEA